MSAQPQLSVVVIGRNEGSRLVRCLESIKAMDPLPGGCEILYVDSASTDGSVAEAERLGARTIVVEPERPCAAVGRNAGWQAARAPRVLFLDGDTLLEPSFPRLALADQRSQPDIAVVWGHRREVRPESSIYNRVMDLDWIYPPGLTDFCGGDALMDRSVLEEVGGFDETAIAGEEPELCRRMRAAGYGILHVDRPMTGHDLALDRFSQYWRRAFRAGYAYAMVADKFKGTADPLWSDVTRRNRVHAAVLFATPLLGAAASALVGHVWPLLLALGALGALALRSAVKAGWKSRDLRTRLLYGVHSQFQQIPIFFGQLSFLGDARQGKRRGLIDYKEAA